MRVVAERADPDHRFARGVGGVQVDVGDELLTLEPLSTLHVEADTVRQVFNDTDASVLWLVVGAPVMAPGGAPVIASLVLAPDGRAHVHPKSRLHGSETLLFTPGTPPPPFDVDGWLVALAVCFDMADPAHAAEAAAAGADLYVSSSVYVEGEERRLDLHHGARAMDHRMYAAMAGQVGPSGIGPTIGGAGVWRPDGVREATLGAEPGLLVRTLRSAEVDRHRA